VGGGGCAPRRVRGRRSRAAPRRARDAAPARDPRRSPLFAHFALQPIPDLDLAGSRADGDGRRAPGAAGGRGRAQAARGGHHAGDGGCGRARWGKRAAASGTVRRRRRQRHVDRRHTRARSRARPTMRPHGHPPAATGAVDGARPASPISGARARGPRGAALGLPQRRWAVGWWQASIDRQCGPARRAHAPPLPTSNAPPAPPPSLQLDRAAHRGRPTPLDCRRVGAALRRRPPAPPRAVRPRVARLVRHRRRPRGRLPAPPRAAGTAGVWTRRQAAVRRVGPGRRGPQADRRRGRALPRGDPAPDRVPGAGVGWRQKVM